jgi:energy-coupling factor transport system permease protein
MHSPATGYYRPGNSWLHHRNPLTKLLAVGWVLLAAFLLPPLILVALAALVLAAGASTGLLRPLLRALRIPGLLVVSILVVNALFYPGAKDSFASVGPVALSREGIAFGVVAAGRILAAFGASILLLFTTLADDALEAVVARGASHRIAYVILSAIQMVPRLQGRAAAILDAQQARGLPVTGSIATRVRAIVPLVGPILLGSLIDVRERTLALEARAFGSSKRRTAYRAVTDPPIDGWLRLVILLAMVATVVVGVGGWLE